MTLLRHPQLTGRGALPAEHNRHTGSNSSRIPAHAAGDWQVTLGRLRPQPVRNRSRLTIGCRHAFCYLPSFLFLHGASAPVTAPLMPAEGPSGDLALGRGTCKTMTWASGNAPHLGVFGSRSAYFTLHRNRQRRYRRVCVIRLGPAVVHRYR